MDIIQSASIYNLDAIPEDAIVTVTGDGGRMILTRAQLLKRLVKTVPRGRKPVAAPSRATKVKAEK